MKAVVPEALVHLAIPTGHGEFVASYSAKGLAWLAFPHKTSGLRPSQSIPPDDRQKISQWHRLAARALKTALLGRDPGELPPLDLITGTAFQHEVWRAMRKIPLGQTASYGEIARSIGRPQAVRAVGGACGANPIPVFIPCHRVLAAGGRLGGFSGGLDWKRKLLAAEGLTPKPNIRAKNETRNPK